MNKKLALLFYIFGVVSMLHAAENMYTDPGLIEKIGKLIKLQKEVGIRQSLEAADKDVKNNNDKDRAEIKSICMSMGFWHGAALGSKISDFAVAGKKSDRQQVYEICGSIDDFKKKHPKAYASLKPQETKAVATTEVKTVVSEEPLSGDAFEILGFSMPYTKYTEEDFTKQYKYRKAMEKDPARLKQLEVAYQTLKDPKKRAALLEEEVEFKAE